MKFGSRTPFLFLLFSGLFAKLDAHASVTIPIDPRATYLRTNSDPGSIDATPIDLSLLGISPGDLLLLEQLGDFSFDVIGPPIRPDEVTSMVGVFSSSATLLGASNLHRVVGATSAVGYIPLVDWVTDPTFVGGLTTDLAEDFLIGPAAVYVPVVGNFLFLTPSDSRFFDNGDPDHDFAIRITKVEGIGQVPEASSLILGTMVLAVASVSYFGRKLGPRIGR